MVRPLRVAINGFGRIGRNVLRGWLTHASWHQYFDIVAINDVYDAHTLAHLLEFDSVHGRLSAELAVEATTNQTHFSIKTPMFPSAKRICVLQQTDPATLPWKILDVDVVLECTGLFRSYAAASQHIGAGATRVIIGAAPFDHVDAAIVYGVNHATLTSQHVVISSVSCTTQALVPLVKLIDDAFGLNHLLMTEIHAMTADQSVLDHTHRDLRRARAASHNIIPTTSSSIGALKKVLPYLSARVDGYSIRVPTLNVAAIDVAFSTLKPCTVDALNHAFQVGAQTEYASIMSVNTLPLVSSDFIGQPYSLIIDLQQTMQVPSVEGPPLCKAFAWYDNESGYAARLNDLLAYMAQQFSR